MRVIKFFTKNQKTDEIIPYVWYIEDTLKASQLIDKIENFLRQNTLICYLSSFMIFDNAKEYDASIKNELKNSKNKFTI